MTDENKSLTQEELEEMAQTNNIPVLEDSDMSDDEEYEPFSAETRFAPLKLFDNPAEANVKPKPKLLRLLGPYNIFKRFWTDSLLDQFVKYTTLDDLTRGELKVFFGVLLMFGLVPKHRLKEHWSGDFGSKEVRLAMSRERFAEIWSHLKIYDGVSYPEDPRKLVWPLLDNLTEMFQEQLEIGSEKSVDEIMVGYFGKKCSQTFFIPRKPSKQKNGIKLQGCADASCGYLWSVFMQPRGSGLSADLQECCTPTGVVNIFVRQLQARYGGVKGTHIYADKWYSSITQAERCARVHKVHFTGTVSLNFVPANVKAEPRTKRMSRGMSHSWSNGACSLVIWKDSAKFYTVSTLHDGSATVPTTRYIKSAGQGWVQKSVSSPVPCQKYTERMGGIDRFNALVSAYLPRFRVEKWTQCIFREAPSMCTANAYVIHKMLGGKLDHYSFQKALVREMIRQGKQEMLLGVDEGGEAPPLSGNLNLRRLKRAGGHERASHPENKHAAACASYEHAVLG